MKKKIVRIICCLTVILIVVASGCVAPPKDTPIDTKLPPTSGPFFTTYEPTVSTTVDTTSYIDPYPDALPINSAFRIENTLDDLRYPPSGYNQPSPTSNDVSIQILRASIWDSYMILKPTKYQTVGPSADKRFVIVAVNVMDTAGNAIITSPNPSNFELIYDGSRYLPTEIDYPIQGSGNSYKSEKIARLEKTGGTLVYEVPSSLTLDRTFIQLISSDDDEKNPVWRLTNSPSVRPISTNTVSNSVTSARPQITQTSQSGVATDVVLNIGGTASNPERHVTVFSAQKTSSYTWTGASGTNYPQNAKAGNIFIMVDTEVKNIGSDRMYASAGDFSASDSEGNRYDPVMYKGDDGLGYYKELYKNQKTRGKVLFEVPLNANNLKLYYDFGNLFSGTRLASWKIN